MRHLLLLLLFFAHAINAVEVPAKVLSVVDGDTITASTESKQGLKIRLLYVDTPESRDNTHGSASPEGKDASAFLRQLLPVGTPIVLASPKSALELDRYGRALAVILKPAPAGLSDPPLIVQEAIIRAGWSPLWEKYGKAQEAWRPRLVKAQEEARAAKAGAWASAASYMINKSNETTASKAELLEPKSKTDEERRVLERDMKAEHDEATKN